MENRKKTTARARLIADGIARNHKWSLLTPVEMGEALEILAEELAKIARDDEVPKIRAVVEGHGLQIPQISNAVQADSLYGQETAEKTTNMMEDARLRGVLTTVNTRPSTVQDEIANKMQVPRKHSSTHFNGMGHSLKNIDAQRKEAPVHPSSTHEVEAQRNPEDSKKETYATGLIKGLRGSDSCSTPAPLSGTGSWTWRNWRYTRIPPAIEEVVQEKFRQGWSKSKLAREFRLNRRTIIRICNAMQSSTSNS